MSLYLRGSLVGSHLLLHSPFLRVSSARLRTRCGQVWHILTFCVAGYKGLKKETTNKSETET